MPNNSLYNKIVTTSPHVEMIARHLYHFIKPLIKKSKNKKKTISQKHKNIEKILDHLKSQGLKEGDILVVHSSFSALKKFGLSPSEIVDQLLKIIGESGTLAMPAIAIYPNELMEKQMKEDELLKQKYIYDVQSTKIWTGALPKVLIKHKSAKRSLHPLNSMVAIGAKASEMMKGNEDDLFPNGKKSSWEYCHQKNAFILGLGTDLTHSLTMIHVAEDTKGEKWYIKDWYHDRKFIVKNGDEEREIHVKERKHKWGQLHFGERNLANDLIKNNVLESIFIEDTVVETLRAKSLVEFLDSKNSTGYPYFWVKKHIKK